MMGQLQSVDRRRGGAAAGAGGALRSTSWARCSAAPPTVAAGLFTTLVVLFYLLVSGETFLRRFVEILPSFAEKRQAVEITLDIERNISAYLITVTLINVIVGVLHAVRDVGVRRGQSAAVGPDRVRGELRADPRADGRAW